MTGWRTYANAARRMIRSMGIDVVRYPASLPADTPADVREICRKVAPYTMTSPQRVLALCDAVRYVHESRIEGAIVECGVWKGGSMMAVAETLASLKVQDRELYLFDTFDGMTAPSDHDVDIGGRTASDLLRDSDKRDESSVWCSASMASVMQALESTKYPKDRFHLIEGRVEATLPAKAPPQIALLRLDTDWYESTRHELEQLFWRVSQGGVLIIDDYGHWKGARKAVDDFLRENGIRMLLNRIDYSGRIGIKAFP